MYRTPLKKIRRAVRGQQRADATILKGAIVGRPLQLLSEATLNSRLAGEVPKDVHYRKLGQQALVYLFRGEMAHHRGKTFFNQIQVQRAIERAPATVGQPIRLGRSALELIETPFETLPSGVQHYWLLATAGRATLAGEVTKPVNLRTEELAISNDLFLQNNEMTGRPTLWLGAVAAPDLGAAQDALEPLNDVFADYLVAEPVKLIPAQQ